MEVYQCNFLTKYFASFKCMSKIEEEADGDIT